MHLRRRHPFRFKLAIGGVILLALCRSEAVAVDWKERLLSEAPPKWSALEQYYAKMEASYRKTFAVPPEGKPFPLSFQGTIYYEILTNGGMMVCTHRHVGKDSQGKQRDTTKVLGVNARYAFELGKTALDAETFILTNFQISNDRARHKVRGSGGAEFDKILEVQGFRMLDIIKNPQLTITNVLGVQRNGKELVQLEYDRQLVEYDRQDPSQKKITGTEHSIVFLDPERYWCIREYHFDNPDWKGDGSLEYGDADDGFPILRRCTHTATHHKGYGTMLITYEFDKLVHRDIPESEFTLSAFGMPELQLPGEQKPRTLWRWLIGIGIALGALAVLFRVYMKKKRQTM